MNPIYHSTTWLLESQLAAYVDAFTHHFAEGRYAPATDAGSVDVRGTRKNNQYLLVSQRSTATHGGGGK